jgi:hypothetical protein
MDPLLGCQPLAVSCFRAFAPVTSAMNEGLEQLFDKILTYSFYSLRGQFRVFFDKKRTIKHAFGRSVAWFWAHNLLNEGVLKLCSENTCCKLEKVNFRWEIFLS